MVNEALSSPKISIPIVSSVESHGLAKAKVAVDVLNASVLTKPHAYPRKLIDFQHRCIVQFQA